MNITVNGNKIQVEDVRELELMTNFDDVITGFEFDFDSLVIPKQFTTVIDEWITNGGGVSCGIPSLVDIDGYNIDSYIDLMDNFVKRTNSYECKLKKRKGFDNFYEYAQGVTFEWLRSQGVLFDSSKVKYLIVPENQTEQALTLYLSLFIISVQIAETVKNLADITSEGIAITQVDPVGASSQAISVGARIVANAVYLLAMVGFAIELLQRLKETIFPKIRELYAPTFKELITKAVEFKGYKLESTLLDSFSDLSVIPVPVIKGNESIFKFIENARNRIYNYPYPTSQDNCGTLWQLVNNFLTIFDAEIRVNNGVIKIETESYFINQASLNLTEAFNLQQSKELESTLNTTEMNLRYLLQYNVDYADVHTLNDLNNTFAEYGDKNDYQISQDLNLLKGLYNKNFGFSLASIKEDLTIVEDLALLVLGTLDVLIGTTSSNLIKNRKGIMQVSNQYFTNTKIYRNGLNGKVSTKYNEIYPSNLWVNYHEKKRSSQNGWELFNDMPCVITLEKALSLLDNNYCFVGNNVVKVLSFNFNWYSKIGKVTYKKKNNYLDGKVTTFGIA